MAISLKEQLTQVQQLNEVTYHMPPFDDEYYGKADHSEGRKAGKNMFYDFYAMEFLWSFLGSGQIPKAEREKLVGLDPDDPRRDIILNKAHRFLPHAAVKTIDSMYEQVTNTVAENLIGYVERAVVQEFQYLVSQSSAWSQFRQEILSKYNKAKQSNTPFTKKDFDAIVKKHIPKMEPYPEVVKRLLKYSKHFSEMHSVDDKDPFDVTRDFSGKPKDDQEPVEFPNGPAPEEPKAPEEPDDTDYDAEIPGREFGKYGGPGQPEYPDKQDWSGMSAFKDVGDLPQIPADDEDDEDEKDKGDVKERVSRLLSEEYINPKKISKVKAAMDKSGITLDDIEKAYNLVPWGGYYGGPKWGAGAVALLKLIHAKTKLSTEDMNHIIDHIYDLQHNTGSLLNKGPMFIDDTDLNRRYKISDVSRFLPFVSPVIKNMILRYYRYLSNDPEKAALQANMENLTKSPKVPMTPEEIKQLTDLGFKSMNDNSYRVGIKFKNKKGESVGGVYYQFSKNEVGTFDSKGQFVKKADAAPMYVVADNLKADVHAFPDFAKAFAYISSYKHDMQPSSSVADPYSPTPVVKSEKDMYIDAHTKIKLTPDKEQKLLDINIGWRKKGNKYYKGYYATGQRLLFYAFSDGSFLITHNNTTVYNTYLSWDLAFAAAKTLSPQLQEYPEKAQAQADILAAQGKAPPATTVAPPAGAPPLANKDYYLPSTDLAELTSLVNNELPQFVNDKYIIGNGSDGMTVVSKAKYHTTKVKFAVGKHLDATGKPYKVVHHLEGGGKEAWPFATWSETLKFIKSNLNALVNTGLSQAVPISQQKASVTPTAYTQPSGKTLPPNSTSKASYSIHVGIAKAPTSTIRLTKEDETALMNIGFEPRLVGDDVWYIHKTAGDTVKFFPNNQAKVLFTSKGGGMKVPGINGTIDKILAWLPTKYSASTTVSPIQTGASVTPPPTPAAMGGIPNVSPEPGIKAGVMFEKTFTDAGFIWDDMGKEYIDYPNKIPGEAHNTLKIAPNRSSTLTFLDGTTKHFKDLATLVAYIKAEYPAQKKSSSLNVYSKNIKVYPSWMPPKMLELLEKGQYGYFGQGEVSGAYGYRNAAGDEVIITPTGKCHVKDSKTPGYVEPYDTFEEVIQYLQEKFGSVPTTNIHFEKALHKAGFGPGHALPDKTIQFLNTTTGDTVYYKPDGTVLYVQPTSGDNAKHTPFKNVYDATSFFSGAAAAIPSNPDIMTKEEEDEIAKIVASIPGLKFKKGYLTEAKKDKKPRIQYVSISNAKGKPLFAVTKKRGKYRIYKVIDNTWDQAYEDEQFGGIKVYLQSVLQSHVANKDNRKLTEEEMDWVEAFTKTKLTGDDVKVIKQTDNSVAVMNEGGDIFRVYKNKNAYSIRYAVNEYLPGFGWKFSFNTFNTFPELAASLESSFDTYTQVANLKADPSSTGIVLLDTKLQQYGFKFVGPTKDGGNGTKNDGNVYDDDKKNRIIYYFDGKSISYVNDTLSSKFGANIQLDDVHSLMETMDQLFGQVTPNAPKRKALSIWAGYHHQLDVAGFVEQNDAKGDVGYVHGTDFSFKVLEKKDKIAVQWSTEKGMKEFSMPPYDLHKFLTVLDEISPGMDGDSIDDLFTRKTVSREEKMFEHLIEQAADYNGVGGYLTMGATFEGEVGNKGFLWDSDNSCYVNEELKQVLLVRIVTNQVGNQMYEYTLFFIDKNGQAKQEKVDSEFLLDAIGPNGNVEKMKSAASGPITEPSGETYKTHDNEGNASLITLNEHDTKLIEYCGFKYTPSENKYYKNPQGSTFSFYDTGKAIFHDSESGDTMPFDSISHALKFAVAKYIGQTDPKPPGYATSLESKMAPLGFVKQTPESFPGWFGNAVAEVYHNPQSNQIVQIRKDSKAGLYYKKDGADTWTAILPDVTIGQVLSHLKKLPSSKTNDDSRRGPLTAHNDQLKKKGFRWNPDMGAYVKNKGGEQEKIIVTEGGLQYYYVNPKGDTKVFNSTNAAAVVNMVTANTFNKNVAKLHGLGYTATEKPIGPGNPNAKTNTDFYKPSTKEIVEFFTNGTSKYGAFDKNTGQYMPYMTFDTLEDAVDYLSPSKSMSFQNKPVMAYPNIDDNLQHTFGFKWKGGNYTKGNQKINFDAGGLINYHYVGDMGEIVTHQSDWKTSEGIEKFIIRLELNNPGNPPFKSAPVRVKAQIPVDHNLQNKYGYKWDESGKQYVKKTDALNTIIFMSDGPIHYYPNGGSGQNYKFEDAIQLFQVLDKEGIKEHSYKDIMKVMLQ